MPVLSSVNSTRLSAGESECACLCLAVYLSVCLTLFAHPAVCLPYFVYDYCVSLYYCTYITPQPPDAVLSSTAVSAVVLVYVWLII